MKWPWHRRTTERDPDLEHTRRRVEDVERRHVEPTNYLRDRGQRNHFTQVWQQIIQGGSGG